MKKYKNISTRKLSLVFIVVMFVMSLIGWFENHNFSNIIDAWLFAVPFFSVALFLDYLFTYLKISETKRYVIASAFFKSFDRVVVESITHLTKEPHPIFKQASWAIFVHYKDKSEKEKHFEIWPSFKPETMGKFMSELQKLNPNIQFDEGCKEWINKYGND